ncbi:MAG TPA: 23S rRNA (guanosine(2251)-2'-O)-methyltransferase RlmB [Chloroflexota bacterium]
MSSYIAGRNASLEALKAGTRVRHVLIDASRGSSPDLREVLEAAKTRGIPVSPVPTAQLVAIHPRHQGVAVEVEVFAYTPLVELRQAVRAAGAEALILALDQVQDPQNLGTLLRTALAVKVTGVLLPAHRGAGVTPAVSRSSAGAVEHLRICLVPNLARALSDLKDDGLWIFGLDVQGGVPIDEADLTGPLAIVVGSEGTGLGRLIRERCDVLVTLPMAGPMNSLNAAVAGSIALYDVFRRRRSAVLRSPSASSG